MSLESMRKRTQLDWDKAVLMGVARLKRKLRYRLDQKGFGTMASSHEILGIAQEEMHELVEAVRSNDPAAIRAELLDVAVACVFGEICMKEGTVDWPWE